MTAPPNMRHDTESGIAARTTFARAQQYDPEFANALASETIATIGLASILSDQPKIMAVRSAETVEALTTVLATIAATDPRFDQPNALRLLAEKTRQASAPVHRGVPHQPASRGGSVVRVPQWGARMSTVLGNALAFAQRAPRGHQSGQSGVVL